MKDVRVTFQPSGRRMQAKRGTLIMQAAREAGVGIESVCGGKGTCGKCKVVVEDGEETLSEATAAEMKLLTEDELAQGYRLACQARAIEDLAVMIPQESAALKQKIMLEKAETPVKAQPIAAEIALSVKPPDVRDVRSDFLRLREAFHLEKKPSKMALSVMRRMPAVLRKSHWKVKAMVYDGEEIIDVKCGERPSRLLGIALDVGTTSLGGYLVDLKTGKTLSAKSKLNPQVSYGDDIISRIQHAEKSEEGLEELRGAVMRGINEVVDELVRSSGVDSGDVYDAVVVGNTAMQHLFFGLSPANLARAPFVPVNQKSIRVKAYEAGLEINPEGYVQFLPQVAGFVGADVIGDVLAARIYESDKNEMLIDVGTNGEIVLGGGEDLVSASTAAGPAFEGAHIKCGMRAAPGAVESVSIDPETFEVTFHTVDDEKPLGICGSGLIEAVAEMLRAGIVHSSGRFNAENESSRFDAESMEFTIAREDETSTGKPVVISQNDIREVQLAKGALSAGISILMERKRVSKEDVNRIHLSGAFGNYINPESAMTIGLLPRVPLTKIRQIGHGAGIGARMALLSKDLRKKADEIADKIGYVELSIDPDFQEEFINALPFPSCKAISTPRKP